MIEYSKKDAFLRLGNRLRRVFITGRLNLGARQAHMFMLLLLPVPKGTQHDQQEYLKALNNFWSGCGDINDYNFVLGKHQKLMQSKTK